MRRARTVPYSRDFAPITVIIICFQILTNAYEGGEEELKGMGRKRRLGDGKESDGSGGRVRYAPRPLPTSSWLRHCIGYFVVSDRRRPTLV